MCSTFDHLTLKMAVADGFCDEKDAKYLLWNTMSEYNHFQSLTDVTRSEYGVTLETHPLSPPVSHLTSSQQHIMSPPPASTPGPLPSPAARARIIDHRLAESQRSNDSDRTIISVGTSGSGSTDSERTPVRVDSVDSQVSDGESGVDKSSAWPRQNSVCIFGTHLLISGVEKLFGTNVLAQQLKQQGSLQ
jgi:hypothetical protein